MNNWLESVYSDGTAEFVSDPHPALSQTVKVRLRMYADALSIFLRFYIDERSVLCYNSSIIDKRRAFLCPQN